MAKFWNIKLLKNIYYSKDNGNNWVSIATSLNTISKTFEWDVPNLNSVDALIKVTDAQNESIYDVRQCFYNRWVFNFTLSYWK